MTLQKFQRLLNRISPKLRVRTKGNGDVAGLFVGYSGKGGYICRLSKGELHLNGFRWSLIGEDGRPIDGKIKKRGRKTVINLLRNYRWVTNHYQRTLLTYGIDYPDELLKGLDGKDQYANYKS